MPIPKIIGIKHYKIKEELLSTTQQAIQITPSNVEYIQLFLANSKNNNKPIEYKIENNFLITYLWNSQQILPINGSFWFITKDNETYLIENNIFKDTYSILETLSSNVVKTKMKQKDIKAVEICSQNTQFITELLQESKIPKNCKSSGEIKSNNFSQKTLLINNLEGQQELLFDDEIMLIQGPHKELYSNKKDKFLNQYIEKI